jgi:Na+-translocating ferredoxin:NAD+ oxidoreductase RnfA subunit
MFVHMILYDFCLLPSQISYTRIIVYIRMFESYVQIAECCAPWKIPNGYRKPCLHVLQFYEFLIPRREKPKSLLISSVPYEGLV